MEKNKTHFGVIILGIASFAIAVVIFATSLSSVGGYRSADTFYSTFEECVSNSVEACEPQSGALNIASLIASLIFLCVGSMFFFSGKLKLKMSAKFYELNIKREASKVLRQSRVAQKQTVEDDKKVAPEKSFPSGKILRRNNSLSSMRAGTTLILISGILAGIVAIILYSNTTSKFYFFADADKIQDVATAAGWSQISEYLLGIGILGKLLIGAAKIVVEGLGGNTRENDEYLD